MNIYHQYMLNITLHYIIGMWQTFLSRVTYNKVKYWFTAQPKPTVCMCARVYVN